MTALCRHCMPLIGGVLPLHASADGTGAGADARWWGARWTDWRCAGTACLRCCCLCRRQRQVVGSALDPVVHVRLENVTIAHTAVTYLHMYVTYLHT